jgi:hypothetical protein
MSILKGQNFSQKVTNKTIAELCFSERSFLEALLLKKEMVK